jgi:hypothetical protein
MSEERKFAILIAATILSARKLAELENPDKPSPKNRHCGHGDSKRHLHFGRD